MFFVFMIVMCGGGINTVKARMAAAVIICYAAGLFIRMLMINSPLVNFFSESNEASTPLTSWKRVTEGMTLFRNGISPYSGDVFHESPLLLRFLHVVTRAWPNGATLLFVAVDLMIALVLQRIGDHFGRYTLEQQAGQVKRYHGESIDMILKTDDLKWLKVKIVAMYLFNPYSLATCLAKSTSVFNNLFTAFIFLFTLNGHRSMACLFVALAAYQSVYPIMFLVPVILHFTQKEAQTFGYMDARTLASASKYAVMTCGFLIWLLGASFVLEGSSDFLYSTYGSIFTVPDLTPNIGVFWYFFTEMFEHFRVFFLWVFQLHLFIYTIPLGIKLRSHPIFLMYTLLTLTAIFKSYPSYGDLALYLSMLPMWAHVFTYARNLFLVACMYVTCTVMAPILYHLWIYAGSANANFYFAITLVFSTAQVFFVTDLLFAYLKREFHLINGPKPKLKDGSRALVQLK